jgi:hypothetical protein
MYELLHRTYEDPAVVNPYTSSFTKSNTVIVWWDSDPAADEYLLERAQDTPASLFYESIYIGSGTSYEDNERETDIRYIYRLSKRRGREWFGPSDGILGVGSQITRNSHTNDSMENAFKLETLSYISNLYYYRTYNGIELTSETWYYVDIPPLRMASLAVVDSEELISDTPTHFDCYVYERNSFNVLHNNDFWIVNTDIETKRFYLKLYPNKLKFVPYAVSAGGKLIQYQIFIRDIRTIDVDG